MNAEEAQHILFLSKSEHLQWTKFKYFTARKVQLIP